MTQEQLFIQVAIKAWEMQIERTDKLVNSLSDDDFMKEIAPGKNRIIYLVGHLIAVNDNILAMYGAGARGYAHLDEAFVKNPDRSGLNMPDVATIKQDWKKSNEQLAALFAGMSMDDWLSKHTAISEEDFAREPHRNKLAVLLNRTGHVAYHLGQMRLALK